jgi:chromosome partitioning protein
MLLGYSGGDVAFRVRVASLKTLALLARKGGAGKTTLAVHLAVAAVQVGRRVLLVDADPQRSASGWWHARAAEAPELVECEAGKVAEVVAAAGRDKVDLVVIDTRPSVEADTATLARLADLVLVPTRASILDLRAIGATIDVISAVKARGFIVLNATPPGRGEAEAGLTGEARAVLAAYPVPICPIAIGGRAAFYHALVDGRAVTEFDPTGRASRELRALYLFTEQQLWPRSEQS